MKISLVIMAAICWLSGCTTVPNQVGYSVYLPQLQVVNLDECAYLEDDKAFVCPHWAVVGKEDREEIETLWVGLVPVAKDDGYFGAVGWLPDHELGLQPDGVVVWRIKP